MHTALHVLTKNGDTLAADIIAKQKAQPDLEVRLMDLTVAEPDYRRLLEEIFAADSIAVW